MAKKVRTPPPPRRVQAPQRRETRRTPSTERPPWFYAAAGAAVAAALVGAVLAFVLLRDSGGGSATTTKTTATNYNALPGVSKSKAPWSQEYQFLADRLAPLGLTQLGGHNGLVMHYHAHLDIYVKGRHITIPALVGINVGAGYLTELHTHDTRGVIHIEAQKKRDFILGQFFAEWGVFLNSRCIGKYCNALKWYLNGKQQTGNPQNLILRPHQEIAIVAGKPPGKIPSSFPFSPGE